MSSPEDKARHKRRLRSKIAKELLTPKYRPRVVKDKRNRKHDLRGMSFRKLVELIQEEE